MSELLLLRSLMGKWKGKDAWWNLDKTDSYKCFHTRWNAQRYKGAACQREEDMPTTLTPQINLQPWHSFLHFKSVSRALARRWTESYMCPCFSLFKCIYSVLGSVSSRKAKSCFMVVFPQKRISFRRDRNFRSDCKTTGKHHRVDKEESQLPLDAITYIHVDLTLCQRTTWARNVLTEKWDWLQISKAHC